MPGKKKKRLNPNKVPISKDEVDVDKLIHAAGTGNLYSAWLLLLPTLCEYDGMTAERIEAILKAANSYITHPLPADKNIGKEKKRVEGLIGRGMPHPHIDLDRIRTKGDMAAVNRKLRENALHSALCLLYMGLETTGQFDEAQLKHLFLNADLSLAEIENGYRTYDSVSEELREKGILFVNVGRHIHVESTDGTNNDIGSSPAQT